MVELFTVKVDISALRENSVQQELYILLVDPSKIQRIHEFKSWVRFLFSVECNVDLVYDDAVIHDLEDIRILTVLKTVRIKRSDSAGGETELQQRLEELKEFKEWHENRSPRILAERSGVVNFKEASKFDFSGTGYKNFDSGTPPSSKYENHFFAKTEVCSSEKGNNEQCSEVEKPPIKSKQMNSSNQSSLATPVNMDIVNENKSVIDGTSGVSTSTPKTPPTNVSGKDSKARVKQRKTYTKPFSMGDVLNLIRSEIPSHTHEDEAKLSENNLDTSRPTSNLMTSSGDGLPEDEDSNVQKKQRKRIRKHKSKKKTEETYYCTEPNNSSLCNTSVSRESFGSKPKHIRFDTDDDCAEKSFNHELTVENGKTKEEPQSDDCEMEGGSGFVDNEFDALTIEKLQDIINRKRITLSSLDKNESLNSVTTDNPGNYFQTNESGNCSDETNNFYNVMHSLCNIRKNNSNPLVFDRFS